MWDAQRKLLHHRTRMYTSHCIYLTHRVLKSRTVEHENIDLTLLNKLHGLINNKIGVTCDRNGLEWYYGLL